MCAERAQLIARERMSEYSSAKCTQLGEACALISMAQFSKRDNPTVHLTVSGLRVGALASAIMKGRSQQHEFQCCLVDDWSQRLRDRPAVYLGGCAAAAVSHCFLSARSTCGICAARWSRKRNAGTHVSYSSSAE